jgi:hypothetical protein
MSHASGSGSEGASYIYKTVSSDSGTSGNTPETTELLEKVVRETLAICVTNEPLETADVQRLREVAKRHAGSSFADEPVVSELVHALLEGWLGPAMTDLGRGAASQIARTLLEDPVAKARLERFWRRLSGEVT